jgi:hypothetical protein
LRQEKKVTTNGSAFLQAVGKSIINKKLNKNFQKLTPHFFRYLLCYIHYVGYKLPLIFEVQEMVNHKGSKSPLP